MKVVYDHYQPPEETENKSLAPIIFLHGRNDTRKTWRKIAQEIAEETGRQAYAYDARNHGDSPWSNEMDLDVLAGDLEEFMKDHDIHKAILIGHSLGGKTIFAFALKKPEVVEKFIVEDACTKPFDPITSESLLESFTELKESIESVPSNANEVEAKKAIVEYLNAIMLPAQPGGTKIGIYEIETVPIKKEGEKYVWDSNMDAIENMMLTGKNNKKWSGVYPGKALFIYGVKSFAKVKEDTELYKFFPQASKVPVESVGHLVHQVCPEKFSELIIDFILQNEEVSF